MVLKRNVDDEGCWSATVMSNARRRNFLHNQKSNDNQEIDKRTK